MPYEYTPPKYAQVIAELQRRIESGEYPPGSLIPSENQLSAEFGIARPTVVRSLRVLRQEGWIDTQQGKGSYVRGRPALARSASPRPGQVELDRDESREPGELVSAGTAPAPPRIASLLDVAPGTDVLCRRRLLRQDGAASEIVTWWVPPDLAQGTGLDGPDPVRGSVRSVLARAKGVRVDHVVEQITARKAASHEAKLLGITQSAPVLVLYLSVRDANGRPLLAIDLAMPGDLHEIEDAYPVG
ncbi:MAG TPA: GntR family transcriptional regulator [Streptosporangiaceae bacterium]|nr:GntR family transcriptional regulator [Streptosporangiaceae bacterium]